MTGLSIDIRRPLPEWDLHCALELPEKGFTVVLGPSGAGKTSLLRAIAGLDPCAGRIAFKTHTWQDSAQGIFVPTHRRSLSCVFQDPSLFDHLDVWANVRFGHKRRHAHKRAGIVEECMQQLGIEHLARRKVHTLSGGEKQRVSIARALACEPDLLLMDEPLAALDSARKAALLPWLDALRAQLNIPVLYITHSLEELSRLADHAVFIDRGRCIAHGATASVLLQAPVVSHLGSKAFALLDMQVTEKLSEWQLARVQCKGVDLLIADEGWPVGTQIRLQIFASDVALSLDKPSMLSVQNLISCKVIALQDQADHSCLVTLHSDGVRLLARITRKARHELQLAADMHLWAAIKSVAVLRR